MSSRRKLLVVQVAALGHDFLLRHAAAQWLGLSFEPLESEFPALTCTAQATFRTAAGPGSHGVTANGYFDRTLRKPFFWEQSAGLVNGPRIWDDFRRSGGSVGILFWQQSLGENADLVLSPAPIHKHHGGMIEDCYSQPAGLYRDLCAEIGHPFKLRHYWGPLASAASSEWIALATCHVLRNPALAPDLLLTYLPVLDYDLQRFGPGDRRAAAAFTQLQVQLKTVLDTARACNYELVVFGDYAIGPVREGAVLPNLALRDAGLLVTRSVGAMRYPDLYRSAAFALVDHEIAHVHLLDPAEAPRATEVLKNLRGVGRVLGTGASAGPGRGAAEITLVAADGFWFAYPWWRDGAEAPEYASHVDIHSKPGYDPCELFFGWPPGSVSRKVERVRGSHGRTDPDRMACWASSCLTPGRRTVQGVAAEVRTWLNEQNGR